MRRPSPIVGVFLTVFFDILSFGVVIPDVQIRAERLTGGVPAQYQGVLIGSLIAVYSVAQLIFGPPLGRWSDRVGRRPVLIVTSALAIVASVLYAFAQDWPIMALSRFVLGMAGANMGVAYAYITDVTKPEERAASMGKIGLAFGLGFMLGPPVGAWLIKAGGGEPGLLGAVSAAFALVNLFFVWRFLPDVAPTDPAGGGAGQWQRVLRAVSTPGLGLLLALFFVANLAFANLESTFYRLMADVRGLDQQATSWILVYVGIVAAVMQGRVIPSLVTRFGELRLLRAAYFLTSPALAAVPFIPLWIPFLAGALVLGVGNGLAQPTVSSLISKAAPSDMRGGVFGVTQSLGAVARIIGPIMGNELYRHRPWLPYVVAGALTLAPLVMAQAVREPDTEPGPA